MKIDGLINITSKFSKGLSLGLGIGALFFSFLVSYMSLKNGQELNFSVLLPIFSGLYLIFVGSKSITRTVE